MSNSYVSHHVHIVFSTKNRLKTIPQELQPQLWAYMAGIARNHEMNALAIGGIADHAHALLDLGPVLGIAKAVQVLKANSSRWIHERSGARFEWQEGYFACSVSKSQVATVRKYIENQTEHHRKMDYSQEFSLLLKRHGLEVPVSVLMMQSVSGFTKSLAWGKTKTSSLWQSANLILAHRHKVDPASLMFVF